MSETRRIKVRCSFVVDVEVPDDPDYDAHFDIEGNHCPGTGVVGAAFDQAYAKAHAGGTCWACALQGKNEIIDSRTWDTPTCWRKVICGVEVWFAPGAIGLEEAESYVHGLLHGYGPLGGVMVPVERIEIGPGRVGLDAEVIVIFEAASRRKTRVIRPNEPRSSR
ncbi:MAG: hypothetical protein ACYC6C_10740 [Coriobacteriia bacterium]